MTATTSAKAPPDRTASGRLYTPEMLTLATQLAAFPPLTDAALHGSARSDTCGGSLDIDIELQDGCVHHVGMLVRACAVGQASAALFAKWITGHSEADVARSHEGVKNWIAGEGPLPSSPDLAAIAEAVSYPARHGAILLPWRAFADAVRSSPSATA